jgi:hypothetical protein
MAYALLLRIGNAPARPEAAQVIAVTAIAMIIGALPHLAVGRPARATAMSARLLAVACMAAAFRPLANAGLIGGRWWSELPVMLGLVVVAWLLESAVTALIRTDQLRTRFAVALGDELRVQFAIAAAAGASALLIAFAAEVMGLAAVAVFAAPLLVTQVALRRYAGIRATYLQTVRALARVTEIGGYVETGHSARVSRLSVAIGRELGMPEAALLELEYAALMHDIGQLSLRDPVPGGATVLVAREEQRRVRRRGDTAGARARHGGRHRAAPVRPVPPRGPLSAAAAVQQDHPRRQRVRRPGGQPGGRRQGGGGARAATA